MNDTNILFLRQIITTPGLSRADLSRIFNVNRSTCSYITKELEDANLIEFRKEKNNGRLGQYIYFNYNHEVLLCIELGKRKIKLFVVNLEAEIRYQENINIENTDLNTQLRNIDQTIEYIKTKFPELQNSIIAIHGTVDSKNNTIHSPFSDINYNHLEAIFQRNHLNFHLINESNAYTLGIIEHFPFSSGISINIKDGVGAGIVIDSKLITGTNGFAGEIGHFIIDQNGRKCKCGNTGCIELYISDTNTIVECRQKTLELIRKKNIQDYYSTNPKVQDIFNRNLSYLAILINNMSLLLNPEFIFITSEVYSKIEEAQTILYDNLKSNNMRLDNLKILNYDEHTLVHGLCKTYLTSKY